MSNHTITTPLAQLSLSPSLIFSGENFGVALFRVAADCWLLATFECESVIGTNLKLTPFRDADIARDAFDSCCALMGANGVTE